MLQCELRRDVWLPVPTCLQLCAQVCLCLGVAGALEHGTCKDPSELACMPVVLVTDALEHGACKGPHGASTAWQQTQTL